MRNKKGITLIAAILLMALLAITTAGLTVFIIERLRFATTRQHEINAYYIAQAGIHYAIWRYRMDNSITAGTYDGYTDRGFSWQVTVDGDSISIQCTGYSPKTGGERMQKNLIATYNMSTENLTGIGYAS